MALLLTMGLPARGQPGVGGMSPEAAFGAAPVVPPVLTPSGTAGELPAGVFAASGAPAAAAGGGAAGAPADAGAPATDQSAEEGGRITREGVQVDFSVRPALRQGTVMAADWADVTFRITDANTGEPISGRFPAAWMDLAKVWESRGDAPMSCRDRVSTYLKGILGVRPMIDLNSHYVLVMNRDASISVIDPAVGITGITNLFAQIVLRRPPADWAKTGDQKRLFVTMPKAKAVAVADTETFKVTAEIEAGEEPTRAVLQADERYLWVGNNARRDEDSGVTVIDTATLKPVAFIQTGKGHHEIALTEGDRQAFVTNRDDGTVTVIDVQTLAKVKDLAIGPLPIAIAQSPLSKAVYVADGQEGTVAVVDPARLEVVSRIHAKPGLGPLRFAPDGRWGVVVNPTEGVVHVIDASTNRLAHSVPVGQQPYQVSFSRQYAYVRSLGTEQVAMVGLPSLAEPGVPPVKYFPAGEQPPGKAPDLGIANSMVPSVKEAAMFLINPFQGTVYYYMEGMNAPQGSFRNYGHEARGVDIVDRSLRETEPGVYSGRVKVPLAGTYDVAFIMDAPRFLHCFSAKVEPNPDVKQAVGPMGVEYHIAERKVPVGGTGTVRFTLTDPVEGKPLAGLEDVEVLYYNSTGGGRTVVPARAVGEGEYEAEVQVRDASTYYVFVRSRSQKTTFTDLPPASLMGVEPAP
jgi:YVTN family beta-propeller protein